jgi:hypothetical protein
MSLKFFKPRSSFLRSDSAVSVAVATALLLGIVVVFITNIQVYHVPQWKEDAEYAHMSEVFEDMCRLKCNMDLISTCKEVSPDSQIILSSPLRMGGGDLPIVNRMKSGGTLTFNSESCRLSATITYNNSTSECVSTPCGTLSYGAVNSRYIDQIHCYENGALLIAQGDKSLMKLSPSITLERVPNEYVSLYVNAFTLEDGNWVMSSNSVEDIRLVSEPGSRTHVYDITGFPESIYNITSASMTVFTEYPDAWENYFFGLAEDSHLQSADYNLTSNSSAVVFTLHPADEDEDLQVKIYKSVVTVGVMTN